ncbi:MAG: substrate-binding domain-containing protein [Actinobacteria bacterium]|nr:substrate-binding domain-containing protein [Actinomycetota bacterium]
MMLGLTMLMLIALVAAGCGGGGSSSSNSTSSSGEGTTENASAEGAGGSEEADLAQAKEKVTEFEKLEGVEWPKPTEPFDPGTGKIAIISCGNAGTNCLNSAKEAETAVKAMGWTPSPVFDGEFSPAKQAGYVQQAVQEGYDGIVLVSIDAESIKSAVDAAAAKGVPITCVLCVNPSFKGKVVDVTTGGVAEGEAIGDWIAAESGGEGSVLIYNDKSFPIIAVRESNLEKQLTTLCPGCEIENAEFPTTDLEKPGSPTFEAALAANPAGTLDYVVSPYDPAAIPMVKAAEQEGRTELKITGWDATPEFIELIAQGNELAAVDNATPFPYATWGAVDQIGRMHAGLEPWKSDRLPIALVTKNNVDQILKTGGYFRPPDFDFEAMFKELWSGK